MAWQHCQDTAKTLTSTGMECSALRAPGLRTWELCQHKTKEAPNETGPSRRTSFALEECALSARMRVLDRRGSKAKRSSANSVQPCKVALRTRSSSWYRAPLWSSTTTCKLAGNFHAVAGSFFRSPHPGWPANLSQSNRPQNQS